MSTPPSASRQLFLADNYTNSSVPSTPSGSVKKGHGAAIYNSLMPDSAYQRRQLKAQAPPPADAAGVVCGTKYNGRGTPLKGKGAPPPDLLNRDQIYLNTKAIVPGKSFTSAPGLLSHDVTSSPANLTPRRDDHLRPGYEGAAGLTSHVVNSPGGFGQRPSLRQYDQALQGSLRGGGLAVVAEEAVHRPMSAKAKYTPKVQTARVFCADVNVVADQGMIESRKGAALWAEQQKLARNESIRRPQTAPMGGRPTTVAGGGMDSPMNEARRSYIKNFVGNNQDVFTHRHTKGICPNEYKFAEVKTRAEPFRCAIAASTTADSAYMDARSSYSINRLKSMSSAVII